MPMYKPHKTAHAHLRRIGLAWGADACGWKELSAHYRRGDGARFILFEGKPRYCGDIGEPRFIRDVSIHGKTARLYHWYTGGYFLIWREHRMELAVQTRHLRTRTTVRIARSLRHV
jgi:hypothetical protein